MKSTNKKPKTGLTVVFVFINPEKDSILVEKRLPTQSFANQIIPPAGHIENNELTNFKAGLFREIKEELGISPLEYCAFTDKTIYGETGKLLKPFIIKKWTGKIPDKIIDKGNFVFWEKIAVLENSPLRSVRELISELKKYLRNEKI